MTSCPTPPPCSRGIFVSHPRSLLQHWCRLLEDVWPRNKILAPAFSNDKIIPRNQKSVPKFRYYDRATCIIGQVVLASSCLKKKCFGLVFPSIIPLVTPDPLHQERSVISWGLKTPHLLCTWVYGEPPFWVPLSQPPAPLPPPHFGKSGYTPLLHSAPYYDINVL